MPAVGLRRASLGTHPGPSSWWPQDRPFAQARTQGSLQAGGAPGRGRNEDNTRWARRPARAGFQHSDLAEKSSLKSSREGNDLKSSRARRGDRAGGHLGQLHHGALSVPPCPPPVGLIWGGLKHVTACLDSHWVNCVLLALTS